jgi:NAD(P)-dependent dehydrogenase (short-subunit alcohol dehydrogenase family)
MHIENSVVVVTSAGSALGSALAEHFASFGAKVVLIDHQYHQLVETYQRCKAISADVHYYFVDGYNYETISEIFDFVQKKFQQSPDILINHWLTHPLPSIVDENPIERFTHNITSMASTLFSFVQLCTERMRSESKEGVIVNIISNSEIGINRDYDNTSSMVSGFTQTWAKELGPYNIRVGAVLATNSLTEGKTHPSQIIDEFVRNTEYIVENEYFSGRVMSA